MIAYNSGDTLRYNGDALEYIYTVYIYAYFQLDELSNNLGFTLQFMATSRRKSMFLHHGIWEFCNVRMLRFFHNNTDAIPREWMNQMIRFGHVYPSIWKVTRFSTHRF